MGLRTPDHASVGSEARGSLWLAAVFAVVAGLAALDLIGDLREGTTRRHALVEGAIVLLGAAGLAVFAFRFAEVRRSERRAVAMASDLAEDLARSREEAQRWRGEAGDLLRGLGELIDRQLERWGLSAAEREVALLLLKGLSHKEVARLRGVGEATARQQAAAVYRKAGLAGRHDLAAFFLEDLLAPRSATDRAPEGRGAPRGS